MRTLSVRPAIARRRGNPQVGEIVAEAAREKKREGLWRGLKAGLGKTRARLAGEIATLRDGGGIDEEALETLEAALLSADAGMAATEEIIAALRKRLSRRALNDATALRAALREELERLLQPMAQPFKLDAARKPFVILMVGVNGAGKTTAIGKLAKRLQQQGHSVLLAAGDTFRAAAVEQISAWGERNGAQVIAQGQGADSASVIYDAIAAGRARGIDVVLADTAGRLQAKANLMAELAKIKRVARRFDGTAPHEAILVLDAGIGQNALGQVAEFDAAVGLTGLIVAKLDGSAKAGILFAIAALARERKRPLPVYFIGVGEQADDLRPFDRRDFVAALLDEEANG